ncbi:MAG TPA: hypothetical protein VGH72_33820 [Pseudonocardia sp.]|jgi:hypothetical protein
MAANTRTPREAADAEAAQRARANGERLRATTTRESREAAANQLAEVDQQMIALDQLHTQLSARGAYSAATRVHEQWRTLAIQQAKLAAKAEADAESGYLAQGIEL